MANKKRPTKTKRYDSFLRERLKNPTLAAGYLSAAIEEGSLEGFLIALKHVVDVQGGMSFLSEQTKLNRQSMYRMFSSTGNPRVSSLVTVLDSLGLELSVQARTKRRAA